MTTLQVLYGGTFDPVHNGHLGVACHARDVLHADIALMPAADPPHKGPTHADAAQRAEMLGLATQGEQGLRVDLRELRRSGPSYTVDTLRELRAEVGPAAPWAILLGADSFRSLHTWHRWGELFARVHVVVASRAMGAEPPGTERNDAAPQEAGGPLTGLAPEVQAAAHGRWVETPGELLQRPAGLLFSLRQPLLPQSASELRRRIAAGEPWRDWVAPAVGDFIRHHRLYR